MSRELIRVEGVDRAFGPVTVLEDINLMVNEERPHYSTQFQSKSMTLVKLNTLMELELLTSLRLEILTMIRQSKKNCLVRAANFRNWKRKLRQ